MANKTDLTYDELTPEEVQRIKNAYQNALVSATRTFHADSSAAYYIARMMAKCEVLQIKKEHGIPIIGIDT